MTPGSPKILRNNRVFIKSNIKTFSNIVVVYSIVKDTFLSLEQKIKCKVKSQG